MGALHSPGTHQPAAHCWFLMTEPGTDQVSHELVMGAEQSVQHSPLSKFFPWPWAVSVVMGIPSVKREVHSYLTDTLNSLISELTQQEKEDSVIVVLIAEVRHSFVSLPHFPGPHSTVPNSVPNRNPDTSSATCWVDRPGLGLPSSRISRCVLPKMKCWLGQRESGCEQANMSHQQLPVWHSSPKS